jgi:hypothetical protein
MFSSKKTTRTFYLTALSWLSVVSLLALQGLWLYNAYQLAYNQFIVDVNDAFDKASQKEQTYRMPVGGIVNSGDMTIQSCGMEEIRIIRHCPTPDTVVYSNIYGQSMEALINKAFYELREQLLPLNIYCLADLFAGTLHDKGIPASFVIERFNPSTGEITETSLPPGEKWENTLSTHVIFANVSETDGLRANLQFSSTMIFQQMIGVLLGSIVLLFIILFCFMTQMRILRRQKWLVAAQPFPEKNNKKEDAVFKLGKYTFDVGKNELQGFGLRAHLNKKENGILEDLCAQQGNVVERDFLLEKHWGSSGFIYSRSLDTYITSLRKYLKDDPSVQIVTVKGVGYKLVY